MATLKEMLKIAGNLENAEKMARKFVKERGKEFLLDLQLILAVQGKLDEAVKINDLALKENPSDVRAKFDRGWFHMRDGDLLTGFKMMNEGRLVEIWGNKHIGSNKPIWDGESGGHILYCCEAGIGDQILFARFVEDIAKNGKTKVSVACSPELMSIFSRIESISSIVDLNYALATYHDYWIPSMGVPVILNYNYEMLTGKSYIKPNVELSKKYKDVMRTDKLKVGIKWRGNPEFEHEQFRKFPNQLFFDAVNSEQLDVFSLQKDLEENEEVPPFMVDMSKFLTNWEETAAIIDNLDLVISSCTGLAHLSAAMGKPTWIVVPILSYWSWALPNKTSPWYQSVKLFRQKTFGSWETTFAEVKKELHNWIKR